MRPYHILFFSLLLLPIFTPCAIACVAGSQSVSSLIREQFDRFVILQRRGPPKQFLMPFYTAYISALDAFVADRGFCLYSFAACCLQQNEVDNFHAIHDRSRVESEIQTLRSIDPGLFYLPTDVLTDSDLPALTYEQDVEVETMWKVTQEALEDRPDSYVAVWGVLPEGLNMLHDPRQAETCAEFEKFKTSAPESKLVTSVSLIHKVTAIAIYGYLLGVSKTDSVQLLFHATAFIFNGIRCEKVQNEDLLVPTTFYPLYLSKIRRHAALHDISDAAFPEVPTDAISLYLGDVLRILSSYKSWGRVEHLVTNGVTTEKRNIKEDIFSYSRLGQILGYMLDNSVMTDVQRTNVEQKKNEMDSLALLKLLATATTGYIQEHYGFPQPIYLSPPEDWYFAYRQTVTCTVDLFHAYPQDPATALSECCADLCDQTSLLQTLTPPLSKNDCCIHCNEALCDVEDNPNNPLSALDEVHLIPYYEEGSEVVNL